MFDSSPVVKRLLYTNLLLFLSSLILSEFGYSTIRYLALFPPSTGHFHTYQLITHMFLHAGWIHLILNMFALATIAPVVESLSGHKKFTIYYFLCGLGSALLHLSLTNSPYPMVGASGAIYGILTLFAIYKPNEKLYILFIPIGVRAKYLMPVLITIEILLATTSTKDGIGHWAHIGGAVTAIFIYLITNTKTTSDHNETRNHY